MSSTPMAGADATWLHMDRPRNLMIVNIVLWFDGEVEWTALEDSFFERVVERFEVFRSRAVDPPLTMGLMAPRWEPVEVSRVDHIRLVRLPDPGDDPELHRYIAREVARPLDDRVPLWQLHLIEGYANGGAVLLRSHHALGAGPTLMHMLDAWSGSPPAGKDPSMPMRPLSKRAGWSVGGIGGDAGVLAKLVSGLPSKAGVLGGRLGGAKSVAWTAPVPLESIKQLARETDSKVNDVGLALVAGSLRRGVEGAAGALVEAMVPVNVRAKEQPIEYSMGNRFGLVTIKLPTDVDNARERIARVKADMDRIKSTHEAQVVFDALTVLGATPRQSAQAWVDAFSRRASVVITNINGPQQPLHLGSVEIGGMVLWVPATGPIGLGVSICSYAGVVRFGVIADTAAVPDPQRAVQALDEEIQVVLTSGSA